MGVFNGMKKRVVTAATKMPTLTEAYEWLGLQPGASEDDLKKAWRKAAMLYHPDRHPDGSKEKSLAEERFKELKNASDVVSEAITGKSRSSDPGHAGYEYQDPADKAPYEEYVDEKGRTRVRWKHENLQGDSFARGFSAWQMEEAARIAAMYAGGASDEAIDAATPYDMDDAYSTENAYVAHKMRERNDDAYDNDFDEIVDSNTPVPTPEKLGADLAAEWYHDFAPVLKRAVDSYNEICGQYNVSPESQQEGLQYLLNSLGKYESDEKFPSKGGDNPKEYGMLFAWMTARNDEYRRAKWSHRVSDDAMLPASVQFFRETMREEREAHGIYRQNDVNFRYILSDVENHRGGESHVPMAANRIRAAALKGQNYIATVQRTYDAHIQQIMAAAAANGFAAGNSPRTAYLQPKLQPLVQAVISRLPPNIKAQPDVKAVVFEQSRWYLAQGQHDWEPDANVHPYHADVTHPMFESMLDRSLDGRDRGETSNSYELAVPGQTKPSMIDHLAEKVVSHVLQHYAHQEDRRRWDAERAAREQLQKQPPASPPPSPAAPPQTPAQTTNQSPVQASNWYDRSMSKTAGPSQLRILDRSTLFREYPQYKSQLMRMAAAVHQQHFGSPLDPAAQNLDPKVFVIEDPSYPQSAAYLPEYEAVLINDAQPNPTNYAIGHEYGHYLDHIFGVDLSHGSSPEYAASKSKLQQAVNAQDPNAVMRAWLEYHQHPMERNALVRGASMFVMNGMPEQAYFEQMGVGGSSRISPDIQAEVKTFIQGIYRDAKAIADHR